MKYRIHATHKFRKQYRKILRQGKSQSKIEAVINALARGENLEEKYRIHKLKGQFNGFHELHIEPDLLLIYSRHENILVLELMAIGSHSELF